MMNKLAPLYMCSLVSYMGRAKRIWYLSPMRAAKVQASLRIRAVSPEPPLLAHTSSESRGTFRQKTRSLAPLNGWACAVKMCHDGMLEDTNSLVAAHIFTTVCFRLIANMFHSITKWCKTCTWSSCWVVAAVNSPMMVYVLNMYAILYLSIRAMTTDEKTACNILVISRLMNKRSNQSWGSSC